MRQDTFQAQGFCGLQEALSQIAGRVPKQQYCRLGHMLVKLAAQMLLDQLLSDEVQAYNLYSLFRLNDDALSVAEFASKTDIPGLEVRLLAPAGHWLRPSAALSQESCLES